MAKHIALTEIRELRRARLNALLQRMPAAELARRSGIDAAYIYQMSKGAGRHKRGISDATAAKIETAANLAPGALSQHQDAVAEDAPHYGSGVNRETLRKALIIVERALDQPNVRTSAEGRAEITLGVYDLLQDGHAENAAGRIVAGMLRAFTSPAKPRL